MAVLYIFLFFFLFFHCALSLSYFTMPYYFHYFYCFINFIYFILIILLSIYFYFYLIVQVFEAVLDYALYSGWLVVFILFSYLYFYFLFSLAEFRHVLIMFFLVGFFLFNFECVLFAYLNERCVVVLPVLLCTLVRPCHLVSWCCVILVDSGSVVHTTKLF